MDMDRKNMLERVAKAARKGVHERICRRQRRQCEHTDSGAGVYISKRNLPGWI